MSAKWNLFMTYPPRLERADASITRPAAGAELSTIRRAALAPRAPAPAPKPSPHQLYEARKAEFFAQQSGHPAPSPATPARCSDPHQLYEARKAEFFAARPWLLGGAR